MKQQEKTDIQINNSKITKESIKIQTPHLRNNINNNENKNDFAKTKLNGQHSHAHKINGTPQNVLIKQIRKQYTRLTTILKIIIYK